MYEAKLKLRLPMEHDLSQRIMKARKEMKPIQIAMPMLIQSLGYDLNFRPHSGLWLEAELIGLFPTQDCSGASPEPIPMLLVCPACKQRHIDEGHFATTSHHTHACQHCGTVWRPALVPTVGVRFLPGFKNDAKV